MLGTGFWLVALLIVAGAVWRWRVGIRQREEAAAQREAEFLLMAATAKAARARQTREAESGPQDPGSAPAPDASPLPAAVASFAKTPPTPDSPLAAPPLARPPPSASSAESAPLRAASSPAPSPFSPFSLPPARAPSALVRPAYLGRREQQAYRLLKAAHPDIEVFPHASLNRLLRLDGPAPSVRFSFLVCRAPELSPLMVVDLVSADEPEARIQLKKAHLAQGAIPYLRWDPTALPSLAAIRAVMAQPHTENTPNPVSKITK